MQLNFKEMKTNVSCESSNFKDAPENQNLKVKEFAHKNQKIP